MPGKIIAVSLAATLLLAISGNLHAQETPDTENGRFALSPVTEGFVRLDTRTGAVSVCTVTGATAECRAAADDRAALLTEIDRLARRDAAQPLSRPAPSLPAKEEVGRAMDIAEEFLRRMMRIMRDEARERT